MDKTMIKISNLTMVFKQGGGSDSGITALDRIDLEIPTGQCVAIVGPSGSGKSTLLGLIAGLDQATSGSIIIDDTIITKMNEDDLARFRRDRIGLIFQFFHLLPTLTALENVLVPLELKRERNATETASALLKEVGLLGREDHYPSQLSGGEMQRVAIARAAITRPALLLADEPTGNLDTENGQRIIDLLLGLNRSQKSTLILVTHDLTLASHADRIISLKDGKVVKDEMKL